MLDSERRARLTRWLVLAGMALSLASYPIRKAGGPSELYPFFNWRLFSEPWGVGGHTTYRIYSRTSTAAPWTRHPITAIPGFSRKQYHLTISRWTEAALKDRAALEGLRTFARAVAPGASAYRIVGEHFDPAELLDDPAAVDTATVLWFQARADLEGRE